MTIQEIEGFKAIMSKLHQIANLDRVYHHYESHTTRLDSSHFVGLEFEGDKIIYKMSKELGDYWSDDDSFEVTYSELENSVDYFRTKFEKQIEEYLQEVAEREQRAEAEKQQKLETEFERLKVLLGK